VLRGGAVTKYSNPYIATYGLTGIDWACAGLVGLAIMRRGSAGFAALLRNSTLRRFGKYSYAMYVFHIQVTLLLTFVTAKFLGKGLMASLVNVSVGIACSYVLALCSWRWIEAPLLSLKKRLAPSLAPPLAAT